MESKIWVFVVLMIAFFSIGAYVFVNSDFDKGNVISVGGNSEITSMPDLVSVYISIETLEDSAEDSKNENAEISEEVMSALRKLNFKDDEIETVSWRVHEEYDWTGSGRELRGYKTVNQIKVEIEEYDFVGTVVDDVIDAGALVRSMNFELSEEHQKELKAQALEEAMRDAKTKAEAVAKGSDQKLGKLVSVNAGDYSYRGYPMYDYAMGDSAVDVKEVATQILPRELTVRANVQAVYRVR
ncbi:MAG: SIMPL domain-containing protein [Nanoarchaeota archaeon]|nr:SIMPL domain-containing protein [Nanoarchaeota archaeon]